MLLGKQKPNHIEKENMLTSTNLLTPRLTIDKKIRRINLHISNKFMAARAKIESINRIRNSLNEKQSKQFTALTSYHVFITAR